MTVVRYDLALVGSGISSTLLAISLLERTLDRPPPRPLQLAIIERDQQFHTGIPYGQRSGATALIITPLHEFLPPTELERFVAWLGANTDWALDDFRRRGGPRSDRWFEQAKEAVAAGNSERLHVPRYLFGLYLSEEFARLSRRASVEGTAECTLIQAEVTSIEPLIDLTSPFDERHRFRIHAGDTHVDTRLAVLALGTPPTRSLFPPDPRVPPDQRAERSAVGPPPALLIDDPYSPGLDETLDRIVDRLQAAVSDHPDQRPEVAIIGANAGSLEVLYQLDNTEALARIGPDITVLSPQGRLPERFRAKPEPTFEAAALTTLGAKVEITADGLLDAARTDITAARSAGVDIADSLPVISAAVGTLLPRLDPDQLVAFVAGPGIEIGRLQRRAGQEYCDAADHLTATGRLRIVAGTFDHVSESDTPDGTVHVQYRTPDGELVPLGSPQHVVVNCSGSAGLQRPNQSALIESLLQQGLCRPSVSGHGFAVDDRFQTEPGLYVHGPLLAGNVVGGRGIWHVEHCGRIIGLSGTLSEVIAGDLDTMIGWRAGSDATVTASTEKV